MEQIVGAADQGITNMSLFFADRLKKAVATNAQVTYYCCQKGQTKYNTATAMLRSVLRQIVDKTRQSNQAKQQAQLQQVFDQQEDQARRKAQHYLQNKDALWKALLTIAGEEFMGPIYCVLDGLDALDAESVDWLKKQYMALPTGKNRPETLELKVVIVSQEVVELRELVDVGLCKEINLEASEKKEHIQGDLDKVVLNKLRNLDLPVSSDKAAEERKLRRAQQDFHDMLTPRRSPTNHRAEGWGFVLLCRLCSG